MDDFVLWFIRSEVGQFEEISHWPRLLEEVNLQNFLQPRLSRVISYFLADMRSQQVFPLEPSAEVGHNGVDIVDEQALED